MQTIRFFFLLFGMLGLAACESDEPRAKPVVDTQRIIVAGPAEFLALGEGPLHVNYPAIDVTCSCTFVVSSVELKILRDRRCRGLRIHADTILFEHTLGTADSLVNLMLMADYIGAEGPIEEQFPVLAYLEVTMSHPFSSDLFQHGLHLNTLVVDGLFASAKPLVNHNWIGTQLVLRSPLLTEFDSLYLSSLPFQMVNVQETPLGGRLDSLCPPSERSKCYDIFDVPDSMILVF